jgi:hypothetical protein
MKTCLFLTSLPILEFLSLVQNADDTFVKTQDLSLYDLQQTNGDQPQSPITEIVEPESAENLTIQAQVTSSVVEVNPLKCLLSF